MQPGQSIPTPVARFALSLHVLWSAVVGRASKKEGHRRAGGIHLAQRRAGHHRHAEREIGNVTIFSGDGLRHLILRLACRACVVRMDRAWTTDATTACSTALSHRRDQHTPRRTVSCPSPRFAGGTVADGVAVVVVVRPVRPCVCPHSCTLLLYTLLYCSLLTFPSQQARAGCARVRPSLRGRHYTLPPPPSRPFPSRRPPTRAVVRLTLLDPNTANGWLLFALRLPWRRALPPWLSC